MKEDIVLGLRESHDKMSETRAGHHAAVYSESLITYIGTLFSPGPFYYFVINVQRLGYDFVSDSVRDILGYEPKRFTLATYLDIIHPDDLEFFHRCEELVTWFLKQFIPADKITKYKIRHCIREKTANGTYKLMLVQAVPMVADEGGVKKLFGSRTEVGHWLTENDFLVSLIGLEGEPSYLNLDVFSPNVMEKFTAKPWPQSEPPYSKREFEVLRLMAAGHETSVIAKKLGISPQTVSTHRKNILRKSGFRNTAGLIAECIRRGYI